MRDRVLRTCDSPVNTFHESPSRYFRLVRQMVKQDFRVAEDLLLFCQDKDFERDVRVV